MLAARHGGLSCPLRKGSRRAWMLQTLAADRAETAPPCRPELGSPIGVCDSAVGLRCNRKRSFPGLG
eukprot:5278565-Prorocentrum_lima.AAC.1